MDSRVISVASGKGGVGKTLTAVNIALSARRHNKRVLILDGDLGMANVDVVLGLRPRYNINDVISEGLSIREVILQGPMGIHIIPSGSGLSELANLPLSQRVSLLDQLDEISNDYDFIVIDTGAGISDTVLHLNSVADEVIVVTTPEPHAMTDAYAFIKVMAERYETARMRLVVNQAVNRDHGLKIARRITDVASQFLQAQLDVLGVIPQDDLVSRTILSQAAGSDVMVHSRSGQAWNNIALKLFDSVVSKNQGWSPLVFPSSSVAL